MLLKMKDIIEKADTNKTVVWFYSAVCVGNAIYLQTLSYAAFWMFSREGENRRLFKNGVPSIFSADCHTEPLLASFLEMEPVEMQGQI